MHVLHFWIFSSDFVACHPSPSKSLLCAKAAYITPWFFRPLVILLVTFMFDSSRSKSRTFRFSCRLLISILEHHSSSSFFSPNFTEHFTNIWQGFPRKKNIHSIILLSLHVSCTITGTVPIVIIAQIQFLPKSQHPIVISVTSQSPCFDCHNLVFNSNI